MLQFIWINVISIHALLAESDFANFEGFSWWVISIHALLAESDLMMLSMVAILILFLSTLSLRRATTPARMSSRLLLISIHALLAESDRRPLRNGHHPPNFYPRSPCGERRGNRFAVVDILPISIHALLAESDRSMQSAAFRHADFYPRSPCGERL